MDLLNKFLGNPDAVLTALVGALVLLYTGIFRGLGAFVSRFTTPIAMGLWFYWRADNPNKINVTLNIVDDRRLDIDTVVADRLLTEVYKNHFVAQMIKFAARRTSVDDPVVTFPTPPPARRWMRRAYKTEAHLYQAAYNPLISEISEKTNNIFSFMAAIGLPMREYRFVLALTYEKDIPGRDQHFRCMMVWEEALRNLPAQCPPLEHATYATRYRTLCRVAAHYARAPDHFGTVKLWLPEAWAQSARDGLRSLAIQPRPHPEPVEGLPPRKSL